MSKERQAERRARRPDPREQVQFTGGSRGGAKITAIDVDEPQGPPADAWWLWVMADDFQIGSGRYGWWANKPNLKFDGNHAYVCAGEQGEPVVNVIAANVVSIYVAQMKHTENPTPPIQGEQP
jgi:hypothetical protein